MFAWILIFTLLFLFILDINFIDFYNQYVDYPLSIGENRLQDFLFPFEFDRVFLRHKWIHLFLLPIYFLFLKSLFKKDFYKSSDLIVFGAIIFSSYSFIFHQLMTINGLFIFFLIPIYAGLAHCFINYKKNSIQISFC